MSELQPASLTRPLRAADRSEHASSPASIEAVWQRHGQALFALAMVVCEDAEAAESLVVQAILDACTPADLAVASAGRQELARYVYVLWQRRCAEHPVSGEPGRRPDAAALASSGVAATTGLTHRQRSAIALALFGDHSYRDVATLLGLPAADVADLMRSGLLEAGRRHH